MEEQEELGTEITITPKSNETTRVSQGSFNISFSPSNPAEFPIVYANDVWDIAAIGSKLAELIDNTGTYDQHALNELFAALFVQLGVGMGGAGLSFDSSFDMSFG